MKYVSEIKRAVMDADFEGRGYRDLESKVAHLITESIADINVNGKKLTINTSYSRSRYLSITYNYNTTIGHINLSCTKSKTEYTWYSGTTAFYKVKDIKFVFYDTEEKEDIEKALTDRLAVLNAEFNKEAEFKTATLEKHKELIESYKSILKEINTNIPYEEWRVISAEISNWKRENHIL